MAEEKNNATCKICGKSYYVCMSCADAMKAHPWKAFTDTSEHYKVFQVVRGFSTGVYSKEEAKEKFKNINIEDVESFSPHIRDIVKDILKEEKLEESIIVESVVEIEPTIIKEVKEIEKVEEASSVSMAAPYRKKKFKVEIE